MKITFLGATEEVTGSRYLIEHENIKILVDCGMFQGPPKIARRNLEPFPIDPTTIDAVVLTHAHIDHSGYIPALVKNGFKGKIYCSKGTYALCTLLLVDSGSLQEGAARSMNQRGGPNHPPTIALYTAQDAKNALPFFAPVEYDTVIDIGSSLQITLIRSGHILGSAFVIVSDGTQKLTFSGDLGRPHQLIMKSPPPLTQTDFLVIESTYGNRRHEKDDTLKIIGEAVHATVARKGVLVIPCFAIARTEAILYCLYQLKQKGMLPNIPIFLDSPMAISAVSLLCDFKDEYILSPVLCRDMLNIATDTRTAEESKKLDLMTSPAIIIAGSGMADGGRVVFHLKRFISDAKNTILFVGFQAKGTEGYYLVNGAKTMRMHGASYPVHAAIKVIDTLSAHADYEEILAWLGNFKHKPKKVFVTHGESESAQALKNKIEERLGWSVVVPRYLESFDLE